MKVLLSLILIGFYSNFLLAFDVKDLIDEMNSNQTEFFKNITKEIESLYIECSKEATTTGNISLQEFNNRTSSIRNNLTKINELLNGIELSEYPRTPTPLDVFSKEDKKIENFGDLLWAIRNESDHFIKTGIEHAIKIEIDWNESTKKERMASLIYNIQSSFCDLVDESTTVGFGLCLTKSSQEQDCFQIIDDWAKQLRNEVTAAINNIIEKMFDFPGDLNLFSQKPVKDGNSLHGIFFMTRHMEALDEAYNNLKKKLNYFESLKEKNEPAWFYCKDTESSEIVYTFLQVQHCVYNVNFKKID